MELTTGQHHEQVNIDIEALRKEIDIAIPNLRIFVDTIDEKNEVRRVMDEEYLYLIVHIPRTLYDASNQKYELVKRRILEAVELFKLSA